MSAAILQEVYAPLTGNGTALGVVTIADTSKFAAGAIVTIRSSTQEGVECIISEVLSATTMALRRLDAANRSGRSPMNAFLVADTASVNMQRQIVPVQDDFKFRPIA